MPNRVLVLDANQRSALAVTRSLGRRGIHVICAERTPHSLAGVSRYCSGTATYPSPSDAPEAFLATLERLIAARGIDVVLPMTDITTALLLQNRKIAGTAALPFPDFDSYDRLANKERLMTLAQSLAVPIPATHYITSAGERFSVYAKLRFPVVIKPAYSKVSLDGRWRGVGVEYARTLGELERIVGDHPCLGKVPLLIQQQISGPGHGVFALYDRGRPVAFFSHRRLRERPPSGGVSVLCESIAPNAVSRAATERLLSHVGWHGVAMVEFKLGEEGTPYLMEVNGRFWGSLQLAIDAGFDFPYLLYRLATGERIEETIDYRAGCRSRWLLGDFDNLYWVLHKERENYSFKEKLRALRDFFSYFSARHEVNRLDDFRPFIHELSAHFGKGE